MLCLYLVYCGFAPEFVSHRGEGEDEVERVLLPIHGVEHDQLPPGHEAVMRSSSSDDNQSLRSHFSMLAEMS